MASSWSVVTLSFMFRVSSRLYQYDTIIEQSTTSPTSTICTYPSTIMWMFLFYERADQNTSCSLYETSKTDSKSQYSSQVSLFDTSCGLIVERKYIRCTALVELYTCHQINQIRKKITTMISKRVSCFISINFSPN